MRARTVRFSLLATAFACLILLGSVSGARAAEGVQTTLLLAPSGQPVGGVWQRWMNDSYMPTYRGAMVLDLGGASCDYTGVDQIRGCTSAAGFTAPVIPALQSLPETALNLGMFGSPSDTGRFNRYARWTLLYEQAHVIDFAYLTDAERIEFAALWNRPIAPSADATAAWWAGESQNASDPIGEWFAYDYAICAMWPRLTWSIIDWEAFHGAWYHSVGIAFGVPHRTFPVLTMSRDPEYTAGRHGHLYWKRPTPADRIIFDRQAESCDLIRYWITGASGSKAGT